MGWEIWVGAAVAIASAAVSTATAIEGHADAKQAAQNAEDNARLQQQQMEYNQRMEEREAAAIEAEGAENARRQREAAERARSQRIAMLGKSGAAMSSGSPLAVLGSAAADDEMAIMDNHYQTARSVAAHRAKATDYGYGAAVARQNMFAARAARPSGTSLGLNIAGGTIGAVGQGISTYSALSSANKSSNNKKS
ncbi:MAG: hypothetical protein IJW08_05365 [Lentisphaeria bacterium]|nr:hypothetical protein [Lentisphaeria bacterium]